MKQYFITVMNRDGSGYDRPCRSLQYAKREADLLLGDSGLPISRILICSEEHGEFETIETFTKK